MSKLDDLAQKHQFSLSAVQHLAEAMQRGNRMQAQFNHPEFGGMGQWQNGMLMIGDAFNYGLKAKVSALCEELAGLDREVMMPKMTFPEMQTSHWWSEDLGTASSSGQQNDSRYAIFPNKARLAIMRDGQITVYNTKTYRITGVSQQQSNQHQHLVFVTQDGKTVSEGDFERVD